MKISIKCIIPVTIFLAIATAVTVFLSGGAVKKTIRSFEGSAEKQLVSDAEKTKESAISSIYQNIKTVGEKALSQATTYTAIPEIISLYQILRTGNIDDEKDTAVQEARIKLRQFLKPMYDKYQTDTGRSDFRLHFHLPNNRSFLRSWRDWQTIRNGAKVDISDDLSSFRHTVVEVNKHQHPVQGIEVGRSGFVIRGIAPVKSSAGECLGTCEVFYPFKDIINISRQNENNHFAVFMNNELLSVASKLRDPAKYPILDDKYILTETTDKQITDRLVTSAILDDGRTQPVSKRLGSYYLTSFPIMDYAGKQAGVMVHMQNLSSALQELEGTIRDEEGKLHSFQFQLLTVSFAMLVALAGGIYFILARLVTKPLASAESFARQIAAGDISRQMDNTGNDEIAGLVKTLNEMAKKLRFTLMNVAQNSAMVEKSSKTLLNTSGRMIDQALEMKRHSHNVAEGAEQISGKMESVRETSEGMAGNTIAIAETSEKMAAEVNSVASAMEEMTSSIREVSLSCSRAQEICARGREMSLDSGEKISQLENASNKIGDIVGVINDITDQTKLLALNATIEAARAGEAGKGFAVVANEVKDLARQTAGATQDIISQIQNMQARTGEVVSSISRFSAINEEINEINTTIAAAMEEQTVAMGEVARTVAGTAQGANQVSSIISDLSISLDQQVVAYIQEASREIVGVNRAGQEVKVKAEANEVGAQETNYFAGEFTRLSRELSDSISLFQLGEVKFDLASVKSSHLAWRARLESLINKGEGLATDDLHSHEQCEFGLWLYSEQGKKLEGFPAYGDVVKHHKDAHDIAVRIVQHYENGRREEAEPMMKQFETTRGLLFSRLDELAGL